MAKPDLRGLFAPKSVAVVGASRHAGKIGQILMVNLKRSGFKGKIYPVNPQATRIGGWPCYSQVGEIPAVPDLAVIAVPSAAVLSVVEDCGKKGVPYIVVISAGFKEIGPAGQAKELALQKLIAQYDMRLIGPNCLGFLHTPSHLNVTFASPVDQPTPGSLAFISQSGALGTAILDVSVSNPLFGLSSFVSLGNKADLDEADLLEYFVQDKHTKAIALYVEGLPKGRKFVEVAGRVTKQKPVIMLKSGRSASAQKAISSHTGSLAGSAVIYEAALAQAGVAQVSSFQELVDVSILATHAPKLHSSRIAIVTNAGGPAILATDALEKTPLVLSKLQNVTTKFLQSFLPESAAVHNPIDLLGDALSDRYQKALDRILVDSSVDAVIVILTPQSMTETITTAEVLAALAKRESHKPVIACFMGDRRVESARSLLAEAKVPVFEDPDRAVRALSGWYRACTLPKNAVPIPKHVAAETPLRSYIDTAILQKASRLSLVDSLNALQQFGISIVPTEVVETKSAARDQAQAWGLPVVLKIDSPDLNHKSDQGGVIRNLETFEQVEEAFVELTQKAASKKWRDAKIVLQPQLPPGKELLIGAKRDPSFGPVVTVALGGIFVEIFKDSRSLLAPVTLDQAIEAISQLQSSPVLTGARGQTAISLHQLATVIVKVSQIIAAEPRIVELDLNPVFAYSDSSIAVDARVVIE